MYFGLSEDQIFFQDNQKNEIHSGIINLGINNILVPEEHGGLGLDLLFATAISQSIGGAVAPLPYCGSYVMAPIAIQIGASKLQKENIFNEMSSGNTKFGIAFSEYFGSRDSSSINFSNEKINGKTIFAIDCDYATDVLVSDASGKIGIVSIEDKNIEIVDLITVDKTRTYKEIKFSNANVEILENTKKNTDAIEKALDAGRIITAADTLGASQAMLDKAVSYSKERKQFNRVIGSFQAVKHMCAEMAADLEPCYSLVWHAAHSFDNNDDDSKLMACHAKSHISEVAKMVSKKATEVHGGMGFTDLLGLHFWFKRIGLNRQLLGAPEIVRNEAAKAQGL